MCEKRKRGASMQQNGSLALGRLLIDEEKLVVLGGMAL